MKLKILVSGDACEPDNRGRGSVNRAALAIGKAFSGARLNRSQAELEFVDAAGASPVCTARLYRASHLRDAVSVLFDVAVAGDLVLSSELALSEAAWDGLDDWEAWQALHGPLTGRSWRGSADPARPWVLVSAEIYRALDRTNLALEDHCQWHVIGDGRPRMRLGRGVVWWPDKPSVVAPLLGRATAVIGHMDALAQDAWRAGVTVLSPANGMPLSQPRSHGLLANLVPATLIDDGDFWKSVLHNLENAHARGNPMPPLFDAAAVRRGREQAEQALRKSPTRWGLVRRRYTKLRRDPDKFFADSRNPVARQIYRVVARQGQIER